ncbi:MAG: RNA polymerase sigma-70 factor [Chitinophagaceae bacterium]|nr:RNA polymerase sigma-70 factor [Chitinophagaceae bacterium]
MEAYLMEHPFDDLIVQFNQGDTEAFTAIYNRYYSTLYYFVKRFIPEREDAEDITADVFVKLWKLRTNLKTIKNIEAFLYVTGRNACLDFLRHIHRKNIRQKELIHALLYQPEEGRLEEDVQTLVLQAIHAEIEKLPRSCRTVFKMAYIDGMSNSQIAEALGVNNQSVRNHKLRAAKLLRIAILNRNMLVGVFITVYFTILRLFE